MRMNVVANLKLEKLKLDLALRNDNTYVGSGLGGDEKEFLKLLSYKSIIDVCIDGGIYLTGDSIFFDEEILEQETILNLRLMLSNKLAPVIESPNISQNELIDLEKCVVLAKELKRVSAKRDIFIQASMDLHNQELSDLLNFHSREHFKTPSLATNQVEKYAEFQRLKENADSAYNKDLRSIYERYNAISKNSITLEERNTWEKINKFTPYIVLFAVRSHFGVDKLAKYDHDEFVIPIADKNK